MFEEELKERVNYLVETYGFRKNRIMSWYNLLKDYPCFEEGSGLDALEELCQRRTSTSEVKYTSSPCEETLRRSVEYALYNVYYEEALPYLSEEFVSQHTDSFRKIKRV